MSVPVTEALAAASNVYTWEPPDRVIAARYGLAPADILRFDTNTSPTSPGWLAEVLGGPFEPGLNEYPDSTYAELAEAAAAYVGAKPSEIIVGCGADEVLDMIAKTFLAAGLGSLVPTPTYSMYAVLAVQRGARRVDVPRLAAAHGFAVDLPAVLERLPEAAVVWLCAPNNPTGAPEARADLEAVLEAGAALPNGGPAIVVDEAYHEFHPDSLVPLCDRFPALIVVRTVSKAFALAGLRVGYAVAARPTIARLERVRPPGSLSTISAKVGASALRRPELAAANAATLSAERGWLSGQLATMGLSPYPSVTNFVLVPFGDRRAADAAEEHLLRHGIVPRTFGAKHPLAGHLRLTVRSRSENERLLATLGSWLDGRAS